MDVNHRYYPAPQMVQIMITTRCINKCDACINEPKNISFNQFIDIIDELSVLGTSSVMLNGGEPFFHPDYIRMVEYLSRKNIRAYSFISGMYITPEIIEALRKFKIGVNIYINSLSEDLDENVLYTLEEFKKQHIHYSICWVSSKRRIIDLLNIIRMSHDYRCDRIIIMNSKTDSPASKDELEFLADIINRYDEVYCKIQVHRCFCELDNMFSQNRVNESLPVGCPAGISSCAISVEGIYRSCPHLLADEAEYKSLIDYWTKSTSLKQLRDHKAFGYGPCLMDHSALLHDCCSCYMNEIIM